MTRAPGGERALPADLFFEYSLLALLACGYFAVLGSGFLDAPTAALTGAGLAARGLVVAGVLRLHLPPRAVTALTLAYAGFYPIDYYYVSRDFLTATVHLVFFLAVLKILTARTDRDYFYVKIIAFLELLAAAILSARLNFFLFLALFLLFGVATFSSAEIRSASRRQGRMVRGGLRRLGWRLAAHTALTVAGILILTSGLFFLLPRTARAAFQRLVPERYYLPGFSNEVALGQIGELKMRSTPVMHARLAGMDFLSQGPVALKWRGAALAEFDGRRWFNGVRRGELLKPEGRLIRLADAKQRWRVGRRFAYEVQVKDDSLDTLFFAGVPEFVQIGQPGVLRTAADTYRVAFRGLEKLRYGAYSWLEAPNGTIPDGGFPPGVMPELDPETRQTALRLPPLAARVFELAADVAGSGPDDVRAQRLETHLRTRYRYTIELPKQQTPDPLAHFLFERREGHCEYFASAMAVMLRAVGIPSRVATGFQSGVYNPISGWYLIRASDAHSWVEAWLPGRGWTTFDPTPPDPNPPTASAWLQLQLYMDAAETFWQDWVLNYNLERQLTLAARMEESGRGLDVRWPERWGAAAARQGRAAWEFLKRQAWWLGGLVVLAAALAQFGPRLREWWRHRQRKERLLRGDVSAEDATLLYLRALELLRARGFERPGWLTPREFARVVPDARLGAALAEVTAAYNDLRFGRKREAAVLLMAAVEELERPAGA